MGDWKINHIEFTPEVARQLKDFVREHPSYKKMLDDRLNDLLEFPDLYFQDAFLVEGSHGYFTSRNQQLELAGEANRATHTVLVTHFGFHH